MQTEPLSTGPAPALSVRGTGIDEVTIAGLTAGGCALLVFVSEECPTSAMALRRLGRGGGPVASVSRADIRSAAASLLRSWDLLSDAVTVRTPPASLPASACSARSFCAGGSAVEFARS